MDKIKQVFDGLEKDIIGMTEVLEDIEIYKITINDGTWAGTGWDIVAYSEDDALDILIDFLEDTEQLHYFIDIKTWEDEYIIDSNDDKFYADEYIIGGNHGLVLYHGGYFKIDRVI